MRKMHLFAVLGAALLSSPLIAATGNFTGPLTSPLLSVDLNGGLSTDAKPTEGWNGSFSSPAFFTDQYGVTWSPWGGSNSQSSQTFGDGTVWPQSSGGQAGTTAINGGDNVKTFTKNFGALSATLAASGTAAQYAATFPVNSRDRGAAAGASNYNGNTTAAANDADMFRDLVFVAGSGSNVQSTNFAQLTIGGLTPGNAYTVAAYAFDNAVANATNYSATPPTTELGVMGYFAPGTNNFTAPADEQTISWAAGGPLPAPAVFNLTANGNGQVSIWGFGGNGVTGNQSASNTYITGFQIANFVPEPASIGLIGFIFAGVAARRRRA